MDASNNSTLFFRRLMGKYDIGQKDFNGLEIYLPKPITMWKGEDARSWIVHTIEKRCPGYLSSKFKRLDLVTGNLLLYMTLQNYVFLFGGSIGCILYEELGVTMRELSQLKPGIQIQEDTSPIETRKQRPSHPDIYALIVALLIDPKFCNDIIKWEDREKGIFSILRISDLIKLWDRCTALPMTLPEGDAAPRRGVHAIQYQKFIIQLRSETQKGIFVRIGTQGLMYQLRLQGWDFLVKIQRQYSK